jgi:molybdate transport system ATP-binding protein
MLFANFEKRYPQGPVIEAALGNSLGEFSITALFGPSGCGKTTILRCLAGLEKPERGVMRFGEETWFDAEEEVFLPPQRRGVGLLFQDYALFPHLTVSKNIGYGLGHLARAERRKRVGEMMDFLRLSDLSERYPSQISGGQQQRVALGRAMVLRPKLLLLDEPLSALDTPTREELRPELQRYIAEFKTPAIVVTHDRLEALTFADHITVLDYGRVLQSGPTHEIFSRPQNLSVARIVGVENVAPAQVVHVEDGLATVQVGKTELLAVANPALADQVYVCIRAEDVILQKGGNGLQTSARNQLKAHIRGLTSQGPVVRVLLDCGFDLTALVTKHACEELKLQPGEEVTALLKAPAIHLLARQT